MDDSTLTTLVQEHLSSILFATTAAGISGYSLLRMLAESYEKIAKVLGPLGARWRQSRDARIGRGVDLDQLRADLTSSTQTIEDLNREISWLRYMRDNNAWTDDLRQQTDELRDTVQRLRSREQMVDAYLVMDANWHRRVKLLCQTAKNLEEFCASTPPVVSILEFEGQWGRRGDDES